MPVTGSNFIIDFMSITTELDYIQWLLAWQQSDATNALRTLYSYQFEDWIMQNFHWLRKEHIKIVRSAKQTVIIYFTMFDWKWHAFPHDHYYDKLENLRAEVY